MVTAQPALKIIELNKLELFACQYMSSHLTARVAPIHRQIYADLQDLVDKKLPRPRLVLLSPRFFGKSRIGSVIFPLYLMCETNYTDIMAFSRGGEHDLSLEWARMIKQEIDHNIVLKADYGLEPVGKWTGRVLEYRRNDGHKGRYRGYAKGMSARGPHPDIVIIDDPQNLDDVRSESIVSRDLDWFYSEVLGTLGEEQGLVLIGTILNPASIIASAMGQEGWTRRKWAATHDGTFPPDGKSIWPEKHSDESLYNRLKEIGEVRFAGEYLNEPLISENPVFDKRWFKHFEIDSEHYRNLKKSGLYKVTACDPAISLKEDADETALISCCATYDKEFEVFVDKAQFGRWPMKETAERVMREFERFEQNKTLVEEIAYQRALQEEIEERERVYRKYVNLQPILDRDKDKLRRAFNVQSLFQQGKVHFDTSDAGQQKLMLQLQMFDGRGTYGDDGVDALVDCLTDIKEWNQTFVEKPDKPQIVLPGKHRSPVTGVI